MKNLSEFTNLYSLQKTLRFELIPQGKTLKHIGNKGLLLEDEKRAENYIKVKKLIDEYHKAFINSVLTDFELSGLCDYLEFYDQLKKERSDRNLREFENQQTVLRKQIVNRFTEDSIYKTLFKKELIKRDLINWLEEEDDLVLVNEFKDFTTYFSGFHENRKNIYSNEPKSTAIAFRLIHENLPKHIDNINIFKLIKTKYSNLDFSELEDLAELLDISSIDDFFTINFFNKILTQKGIERYNDFIGGYSENQTKVKGFNEIVNLYRQKNNLRPKDLPTCKELYKQILSDRDTISWLPEVFDDDNELLESLQEFYTTELTHWKFEGKTYNLFEQINNLLNHLGNNKFDKDKIYIKNDNSLNNISQQIFGDWSIIHNALDFYYQNELNPIKGNLTKKYKETTENWVKKSAYHKLNDIEKALLNYKNENDICNQFTNENTLCNYFAKLTIKRKNDVGEEVNESLLDKIGNNYSNVKDVLNTRYPDDKNLIQDKTNVTLIKEFLDSIRNLLYFIKPFHLGNETFNKDEGFYAIYLPLYDKINLITPLYNKTRNYLSRKPYSTEKFKLNFENSTLLDGWDLNKESDNTSVLFIKEGMYYLGIMAKRHNKIFKNLPEIMDHQESYYEKVVYKLLPGANKMLPKVFFSKSRIDEFSPSKTIVNNYKNSTHKKGKTFNIDDCRNLIDFFKESIKKHPEWKDFNHQFSVTKSYEDLSGFYREVEQQGYKISYKKITIQYINQLIEEGKLYLFQIYNKDFSKYSKGKPNLHTIYWRNLFDKKNLADVVYKLNGQAEVFYRKKSLNKDELVAHKANKSIKNKNPLNPKAESVFNYDIIKNRRYTCDKFQFHVPITLNFKAPGIKNINSLVFDYLKNNSEVNIIGIDRGERHLLYISLINQKGEILKQESLNIVANALQQVNYQKKLHQREKLRDKARKSWDTIETIKELKEGYLSQVVHEIAMLIIEHNAIVVLEDLNFGFKRGRQKVEKQVYQKFEKMLIDKLNYLVFKNIDKENPKASGGSLKAYQLTNKFKSFQKLGKQSGFLFYVPAWNTSKIDPATGFVNFLYPKYESIDKSISFFEKFDKIRYNENQDYFEFEFDYDNFTKRAEETKTKWKVCTTNIDRFVYNKSLNIGKGGYGKVKVTAVLKELFDAYDISYKNDNDLLPSILKINKPDFMKKLTKLLQITLSLRHNNGEKGEKEEDYILSPVANGKGEFFNSKNATEKQPIDADANGAYHIALKGLWVINQMQKADNIYKTKLAISNKEWLKFVQEKPFWK